MSPQIYNIQCSGARTPGLFTERQTPLTEWLSTNSTIRNSWDLLVLMRVNPCRVEWASVIKWAVHTCIFNWKVYSDIWSCNYLIFHSLALYLEIQYLNFTDVTVKGYCYLFISAYMALGTLVSEQLIIIYGIAGTSESVNTILHIGKWGTV